NPRRRACSGALSFELIELSRGHLLDDGGGYSLLLDAAVSSAFMKFASLRELAAACRDLPAGDAAAAAAVAARDAVLTKPAGSLGRLEAAVTWLARWQERNPPRLENAHRPVFARNH